MEKSEQINELASALSKAQAEMSGAKKDSANPFFKSNYADLASVWDAIREPFSKNGLAVLQLTGSGQGSVEIKTVLTHSSGQWIASTLHVPVSKPDAQGVGSAISYGRRYSLAAMTGVYQVDDDGEAAVGRDKPTTQAEKPRAAMAPPPVRLAQQKPASPVPPPGATSRGLKDGF